MTWTDVVSSVRERFRRGFGRDGGREMRVARQGMDLEQLGGAPLGTPTVDVYENEKELLIHADVPGGARDGATVAWDEARGLTIFVESQALPPGTLWASEYQARDWYRTLRLPNYVDGSKATCAIRDGVLTIHVPKRAAASKLIAVRAG